MVFAWDADGNEDVEDGADREELDEREPEDWEDPLAGEPLSNEESAARFRQRERRARTRRNACAR